MQENIIFTKRQDIIHNKETLRKIDKIILKRVNFYIKCAPLGPVTFSNWWLFHFCCERPLMRIMMFTTKGNTFDLEGHVGNKIWLEVRCEAFAQTYISFYCVIKLTNLEFIEIIKNVLGTDTEMQGIGLPACVT